MSIKYIIKIAGIFIIIFQGILYSSSPEELMKEANSFYQKSEYKKAIDIYEELIKEGYEGTSLYYNLGNSYYRSRKLGYAILNYEKAAKLSPGDDDVQHNLALAYSKTIDKIDELPEFFIFQWWEGLLNLFPISGWTYTSYIFYVLLLITSGLYFFNKNPGYQKILFISGLTSAVLLTLSVILLVVNLNRELNIKNGIVVQQTVTVKLSPDTKSNDAFIIHEGLKVKLEDKLDDWVKIRLYDGKVGWIQEDVVKLI